MNDNINEVLHKQDPEELDYDEKRFREFLGLIFAVSKLSGFYIENRMVIKDKRTGRIWE